MFPFKMTSFFRAICLCVAFAVDVNFSQYCSAFSSVAWENTDPEKIDEWQAIVTRGK
jgi:hypothetical protein